MTDSENTYPTENETTRTHLNQSLDTLISLIIVNMAVCSLSLLLGSSESPKTLKQKFLLQIGTPNPHGIKRGVFIQLIYSCFLVIIFPPVA